MPDPSQVSAIQINDEIQVTPNTTSLNLNFNNTLVRNLAKKSNLSNTTISYGDCRWGINFPAGTSSADEFGNADFVKNYASVADIFGTAVGQSTYGPPVPQISTAQCYIEFNSNGVLRIISTGGGDVASQNIWHVTWLTSGVNSDYTANLNLLTGAVSAGSAAVNTDLVLSTSRTWFAFANTGFTTNPPVSASAAFTGNLIIKSAGTVLIHREIDFSASATVIP